MDSILVARIQLTDKQIYDGEQIGYEDNEIAYDAGAITCYRKEQIHTCYGRDEAVDGDVRLLVHQSAVLPDGQSCDDGEKEHHRSGVQETGYHTGYKEYTCNGAYDQILLFVAHKIIH